MRRYLTTAIDYPNAAPHMGHVLEKVMADVIVRWWRLSGDEVRFQIGTDEHGIKIQQTADREKVTPKDLVDRNVPLFKALYDQLHISADVFIRTSDQKTHWPTVVELWKRLEKAGMLEKRTYTGLYCSGCERFLTKKDLEDGKCPIHLKAPEEVKEENWFFLLSKEQKSLQKLLKHSYKIEPQFRAPETMTLLEGGLDDVSFSRPKTSLSWGVPVPGDENQVMYVWCDALTNYISGLGLLTGHAEPAWWDDAEVTHVIGKDIARFHALIWPAMLKHADVRLPARLLIHGFVTSKGQKMSKSLGNVVNPVEVIEKYGVDALRFYLSHEIPVGNDCDFSWKRFGEVYDAKLRNQLGNLLNRVLSMLKKQSGELDPSFSHTIKLNDLVAENWHVYEKYFSSEQGLDIHTAIAAAMNNVERSNNLMTAHSPWTKPPAEKVALLTEFAEVLRHTALMLLPFMPETARKISQQLEVPYADRMPDRDFIITDAMKQWGGITEWKKVGEPSILFAPVD